MYVNIINRTKLLITIIIFALSQVAFATNKENAESDDNEFDMAGLIMHHIKDQYGWTLWSYTNHNKQEVYVTIPLPVIVYADGQLDIFLSSAFEQGKKVVNKGKNAYILYHEKIYLANIHNGLEYNEKHEVLNAKPLDFSITRNVAAMIIVAALMFVIFLIAAHRYKLTEYHIPRGLTGIFEPIILFVRDEIAEPNIGKHDAHRFMGYLLTVFFFILFNNLLGLIPFFPGASNVTGNIAVTMTLAVFTFLFTNLYGSKDYWKHMFMPESVPKWILPILIPIEIVGLFTKPFALMIRLFANITAGHIIILSLISMIFIFKSLSIAPISVAFGIFMFILEILVAFLQAYIFTMLSALFIGMAVQKHH
jgi:F-type H+-transporting ATPase subunit a